ncbi:protein dopey-1 homolog isoform X2 [Tribolium castaneum]|uniref:Protein dopey-1 homolog-like Protein n=1 Tax=Tribolium castaneum TaxID=7070 RepID=A0A139WKB1_TRICA|nr:PREDICTED: protein dopey-1 homolog isoform X2 [Tribolium castaneum]KYB28372.1 Protein dopey-1 homolog-like Protein [Tribolium castaneum]|eukprot:XP_015833932.1 PREDICTED: protein dopey-1 homolog isoform X2 [Tribolium castaneum]
MTSTAMEEYELMKDAKYRMYVAAIDKALKNFEYTSEWADLISALGKLNKVLSTYMKFPVIPRRIKISKRLAQCMHPALPSGVHLKALETYDIIFRCMGTNRLSQELFIYSAGLFPLLGHAAMNIRPTLLTIYETHFVPLGERLRPALSGFLSGVLPGLETGSDHFDRTNTLLENICDGVGSKYFYTCIWQCVTNNSPVRLPAISYVLAHYSRKLPMDDQLYLMGHDIDLMVCGLCAAVQDSSVLVQRSALDLLMVCFPMHNKQLLYADMVRLVTAALSTILRRDMSLNRRLYSWLVEGDTNTSNQAETENTSLTEPHSSIAYDLLNDAIRIILRKSSTEVPLDIKPYRLLTSLFDKPQIGPVILDSILYDVFRTLYLSCLQQQKQKNSTVRCVSFNGDLTSLKNTDETVLNKQFVTKKCQELVKNANLLFNTLQNYYIWSYIEKLYANAVENIKNYKTRDRCQVNEIGAGPPHILEICILTEFLLEVIPIESYAETTSNILPNLFNKIVTTLKMNIEVVNQHEIEHSLLLCTKILTKIQPVTVTQIKEVELDLETSNVVSETEKSLETSVVIVSEEPRTALEKSKSDSKINENLNKNELTIDDSSRERSYSNQMLKKKDKTSPKIEKKSKNKKSKSSSKLYELNKSEIESEVASEEPPPEPPKIIKTAKIENKYFLSCLEEYKQFYVIFIASKILPEVEMSAFFEHLLCDKDERTNRLIKLLEECLQKNSEFSPVDFSNVITKNELTVKNIASENATCEYESAMNVASNVLLEFSAFPNLIGSDFERVMPQWLQALIVAACCKESSREIQITAMSTLLEVFSLAKNQNFMKRDDCNTNIVITGILECEHVLFIEENTVVIEEMAQILWNLLGILNNQKQLLLCVTLLYQIHNTFDNKPFVEQVISKYLTNEHICTDFMKRFFLLWHLGRDLNIKVSPNMTNVRNFDRSLMKVLDNLQNIEKPNIQLLAESFLTHSLLHGDIPRIINPMLVKLLASNTARVSIRHVNINDSDVQSEITIPDNQKTEEYQTKKIYAVSSQNGNIMYHLASDQDQKPAKRKWFTFSKGGKKFSPTVVNMTTSVVDDLNVVTRKNKDYKNVRTTPKLDKSAKGNMKVIINPLSSKEIYSDGLNGSYSKLDVNRSSTESLSSSNDGTPDSPFKSLPPEPERDSGYESFARSKTQLDLISNSSNKLLESIEPISDGIKDDSLVNGVTTKIPKSQSFDEKCCNGKSDEMENSLVHSWSYCISDSDNLNAELEISTSAEEFFNKSDNAVVTEILNEVLDKVCELIDNHTPTRPTDLDLRSKINVHSSKNCVLYPIHSHICLYYEVFDSNQILYALQTLKNCILCNPQLFIKCLATSGVKDLKNNDVLNLLARHRKSVLGYSFSGKLNPEYLNFYRGYMFLDVVILICLNYARTFYPHLDDLNVTSEDLESNFKIQLESLEILDVIIRKLITMVSENSKGFASYIGDMLIKCKLQKVVLHCLLTSVRNFDEEMTFAEEVLLFNNFQLYDANHKVGDHVEAYQTRLLRLIHSLIILEYHVFSSAPPVSSSSQESVTPSTGEHLNYTPTILIPQQNIFLSAVMSALRHTHMKNLHEKWLNMITCCLPYFGENIKQITISVIHQICNNIEEIACKYTQSEIHGEICSDYAVTQLESLTILCHYCLLDSSQTVNQLNIPASSSTPISNPGEIFNNLVSAFFAPVGLDNSTSKQNSDHYQNARKTILSHMPRIISSVAKLWQTIVNLENDNNGVYGSSKVVKQQLLEFLSPISVNHGASFLAAIAVAWYERRNLFTNIKAVLPEPNAGQNNLVYLISAIRVIPLDNLVQTVTAVIKNPPPTEGLSADICLDVSVLELFYCYMRNASPTQLTEAWSSLLALIREGCSLSPPAQFLLAALLHELMIKCCPLEERKDQKDLQDVTAKLIECVSQVCGSCLEQTTWLRRNLAVKEQDEDLTPDTNSLTGSSSDIVVGNSHSVQAQLVLSEILAPILDICFGSSEKDKVVTILTSLMYNIVPYLKTHTMKNMPSFHACSKLLAALSSYQYTRKAWKKDVFELLLDNSLFQMDYNCIKYWKIIVDNLMTHDNTTFRDLMSRVSLTQSGSLSIFSSREQEYEQRAQLLKRLAYVIFCSEMDQYAKYMPDIQEQLTSSLRLNVPGVQAQVFLCFRVILIRMSPIHITSLWPIIISEMLQVFLQIEQELLTDTEEFSYHIKLLSTLDASWSTNSNNGLHALGHPHWLRLQLATAKLLDLALLLPAVTLPQFQMYRWAFVGDDLERLHSSAGASFIPHVVRIANLMDKKFTDTQIETLPMKRNELLLTMNSINQLKDLHSFFKTLSLCSNRHRTECSKITTSDHHTLNDRQSDKKLIMILEKIDKVIEMDFLDKIPR